MATVAELNSEINSLQEELRKNKSELSIGNIQVKELRATLEELRLQLMQQVCRFYTPSITERATLSIEWNHPKALTLFALFY